MRDQLHFAHRLTADSAYKALPSINRRLLHGAAADALAVRIAPGTVDELPLRRALLLHLAAAGRPAEAHACACVLLEALAARGEFSGWEELLVQAEAAWNGLPADDRPRTPRSAALLNALAVRALTLAQMPAAADLAGEALQLALAEAEQDAAARALLTLAVVQVQRGEAADARAGLEQAMTLAGQSALRGEVQAALAKLLVSITEFERAWPLFDGALELARREGNLRAQADVLMSVANAKRQLGEFSAAQELRLESLELARAIGDRRMEGWLLGNLAGHCDREGRRTEAIALLQQALVFAAETGDRAAAALFHGNLGVCYGGLGRLEDELAQYELALAEHRALGSVREIGITLTNLTDLRLRLGQPAAARVTAEEAVELLAQTGDRIWHAWSLGQLGRSCYLNGDTAAGERCYRSAAELLRDFTDLPTLLDLLLEWIAVRLDTAAEGSGRQMEPATSALLAEARLVASSGDRQTTEVTQAELSALEARCAAAGVIPAPPAA